MMKIIQLFLANDHLFKHGCLLRLSKVERRDYNNVLCVNKDMEWEVLDTEIAKVNLMKKFVLRKEVHVADLETNLIMTSHQVLQKERKVKVS